MTPPAAPPPARPAASAWWQTSRGQVAAAVAAVLVIVVGIVVVPAATSSKSAAAQGEVFLAPVAVAGSNPFTVSVVTSPPSTVPAATVPPAAVVSSGVTNPDGSTPGLYGGTRNVSSCDQAQLLAFLNSSPDKAGAWADSEGIGVAELASYVSSLTPVLLRADTFVTNHGFADGRATPFQAVLQAGTAVLIDHFGVPRARCYCGNPLLPPAPPTPEPTYTGTPWTGFDPAGVVTVAPAARPMTTVIIVDVTTGNAVARPVGTGGRGDTDAPAAALTTTTTSTTSTTSTTRAGVPTTRSNRAVAAARALTGNYQVKLSPGTFSGTPGLTTSEKCTALVDVVNNVNVSKNLSITVTGSTITIVDADGVTLVGPYDPVTGKFDATGAYPAELQPGVSETATMVGTFAKSGALSGTFAITVSPPTATCTLPITGAKV